MFISITANYNKSDKAKVGDTVKELRERKDRDGMELTKIREIKDGDWKSISEDRPWVKAEIISQVFSCSVNQCWA